MAKDAGKMNITYRIDRSKHRILKTLAAEAGVSVQSIIDHAMTVWINTRTKRKDARAK